MRKDFVPTVGPDLYYTDWFEAGFEEHWPIGFVRMDISNFKVKEKEQVRGEAVQTVDPM